MRPKVLSLALVVLGLVSAQNLLVNGGFEQPLSVGWAQTVGGVGTQTVERGTGHHPDPDYEAYLYQFDGGGWTKLGQMVDVPGSRLAFTFWGKFEYGAGSSTCWPVAAVTLEYCDAGGNLLGESRFYYHNAYCNWTNSGTLHLLDVASPDWQEYSLDIHDEIAANLPGVNPDDVRKVRVSMYGFTSGG